MGLRFRRSIKVAPGVRVNVGKKSVGVSVGGKYGGVSVNSKTGTRARVSAPGTGISYSAKIDTKTKSAKTKTTVKTTQKSVQPTKNTSNHTTSTVQSNKELYEKIIKKNKLTKKKTESWKHLATGFSIFFILLGLFLLTLDTIGIIVIIVGIILACQAHMYGNILKTCFKKQGNSAD